MLTAVSAKNLSASRFRFTIIASQYNAKYVDAMLDAAQAELTRARAKLVQVVRVPGAYEIPIVAAELARQRRSGQEGAPDAILCLGVILRGETVHAAHIGEAVSRALMQLQIDFRVPIIHEVLLLENEEQAKARCLGQKHNRGAEAAQTAISMAEVMYAVSRRELSELESAASEAPVHKAD